jgi:hypothetical protein
VLSYKASERWREEYLNGCCATFLISRLHVLSLSPVSIISWFYGTTTTTTTYSLPLQQHNNTRARVSERERARVGCWELGECTEIYWRRYINMYTLMFLLGTFSLAHVNSRICSFPYVHTHEVRERVSEMNFFLPPLYKNNKKTCKKLSQQQLCNSFLFFRELLLILQSAIRSIHIRTNALMQYSAFFVFTYKPLFMLSTT